MTGLIAKSETLLHLRIFETCIVKWSAHTDMKGFGGIIPYNMAYTTVKLNHSRISLRGVSS